MDLENIEDGEVQIREIERSFSIDRGESWGMGVFQDQTTFIKKGKTLR